MCGRVVPGACPRRLTEIDVRAIGGTLSASFTGLGDVTFHAA